MRPAFARWTAFLRPLARQLLMPRSGREKIMKTGPEIVVTLSDELMESLRAQAQELKIPLKWLVAGLVCDTIEPGDGPFDGRSRRPSRHVA
jgi:hypothetical protein